MHDDTPIDPVPARPVDPAETAPPAKGAVPESCAQPVVEMRTAGLPFGLQPASRAMCVRAAVVSGLTLLLMIPLHFLTNVVEERAELQDEAVRSIASQWGGPQLIKGPVLAVPYSPEGGQSGEAPGFDPSQVKYVLVLPQKVDFAGGLASEQRRRGIYNQIVYTAPMTISGEFHLPEEGPLANNRNHVFWEQAVLYLGVSNLEAVASIGTLTWEGGTEESFKAVAWGTDIGLALHSSSGLQAKAVLRPEQRGATFSLNLSVKGSGMLSFTPVGATTTISLKGDWPSPNFTGRVLPDRREIGSDGFSAVWSIPNITRAYPQSGETEEYRRLPESSEIGAFTAGVSLHDSVPLDRQIVRAVKYGALFIGLTFTALFCFEMILRTRLHLIQYGLVGVSMCLFYLVLLALAEQVPFAAAFAAAGGVSVLMNSVYVATALHSRSKGAILAALLVCLYGVLYALLQLEDYAVLCGTALVTIVVGVLMYLTRNLATPAADEATPEAGA